MISGPVVVGGVGGSGTRVVARILLDLGFNLGNDLNRPLDDRWFNLLFYRPPWFHRGAPAMSTGFELMRKRAMGERRLTASELRFIGHAISDVRALGFVSHHPSAWAARRLWRFWHAPATGGSGNAGWGWKEPISHLLAPQLLSHFEGARYVHVLRNGLDMAFSDNRRQARRFGGLVGVAHAKGTRATPPALLHYWVRANQRVIDEACSAVPDRTHILNFDKLCAAPETEINRLVDFLGIRLGARDRARLARIPKAPASLNRFAGHDLAAFDVGDLAAVERMGFRVGEAAAPVPDAASSVYR